MQKIKLYLSQNKTAAKIILATVIHPHRSDYSLESCSPAELSSASSDVTKQIRIM